jgi:hypothetical protein
VVAGGFDEYVQVRAHWHSDPCSSRHAEVPFSGWDGSGVESSPTDQIQNPVWIDIEHAVPDHSDDAVGLPPIVRTRATRSRTRRKVLNVLIELDPDGVKPHAQARCDFPAYGDPSAHRVAVSANLLRYGRRQVAPPGTELEESLPGCWRRYSQHASDYAASKSDRQRETRHDQMSQKASGIP